MSLSDVQSDWQNCFQFWDPLKMGQIPKMTVFQTADISLLKHGNFGLLKSRKAISRSQKSLTGYISWVSLVKSILLPLKWKEKKQSDC